MNNNGTVRIVPVLALLVIILGMSATQASAALQVKRRHVITYSTDFEHVTMKTAHELNMGINNWIEFGGNGGASAWMEGLDRKTPGISCYSGTRCVGMELTNITLSRRAQFQVLPVVGSEYSVSVWLYIPSDWALVRTGSTWDWYEIANPYMHTTGAPYTAVWINQRKALPTNYNIQMGGRDPANNLFTLDTADNFALPLGRWFNLRYYVHLDTNGTNGRVIVWLDGKLISDRTGLQTGGFYETSIAKIYYSTADKTSHRIWVDDLEIWDGLPW
jgi:hypothetical protein